MKFNTKDFPLQIEVGFKKLFDQYRNLAKHSNAMISNRAKQMLEFETNYPELSNGLRNPEELNKYHDQIEVITQDLFSPVLQTNEIKFATLPFQEYILRPTERYQNIIKEAPKNFKLQLMDFDDDRFYIFGCSMILSAFYGYKVDFRRPFYYKIPGANGIDRSYRVNYNADFMSIEKTDKAIGITKEDVSVLLENFDNINIWKEKFPAESWLFKGFVIANLIDVTMDVAISEFKALLIQQTNKDRMLTNELGRIFQNIFNLPKLQVGFTEFNEEEDIFELVFEKQFKSYILNDEKKQKSIEALCPASYNCLFEKNENYCVTHVSKYANMYPDNVVYKKLKSQGIESAIFASILDKGKVIGVLELVSQYPERLNTVNATKLQDIMPFLEESVIRAKAEKENEIELVIQEECTSIHNSVHWKFKREAKRYLAAMANDVASYFREIVFDDVHPLYGQMDIKGSSVARNKATVMDLKMQLKSIQKIINEVHSIEKLPIYEQIDFRIEDYLKDLTQELQVDSERIVLSFLQAEIVPLFNHLSKKNTTLQKLIDAYYVEVDKATGLIYKHRKDYDETVMFINKRMASLLDKKQLDAQAMYPHYYERYKTDGVEHSMYIGESITKRKSFHKVYLYNLRLWQLQAMWEMENTYYKIKKQLAVELDVASMILVFNGSLSLRFRMDEKRFDVDGTYNARYEVVKKRVDKSLVKGTEERVTQAGKITIIYSQEEDEQEYKKYIGFLQAKKQLGNDVEVVDIEDLQGVTGLKALRVSVLYASNKKGDKEYYTYDDLMEHIKS